MFNILSPEVRLPVNAVNDTPLSESQSECARVAFSSLMDDYSRNCSIDCVSPNNLSLPLINQINSLHILRHFQISRLISLFFQRLLSYPDPVVVLHFCVCIFVFILESCYLVFCFLIVPVVELCLPGAVPIPCCSHHFLHSHDFYFGPIIPLGHQPGSLHQQWHPFLCKS